MKGEEENWKRQLKNTQAEQISCTEQKGRQKESLALQESG